MSRRAFLAALPLGAVAAGCWRRAENPFRIALPYDVGSLDPHVSTTTGSFTTLGNVFEPLVFAHTSQILRPALAYGADPKRIKLVSFKSGGDLMIQLLGGHVPVISTGLSEAIEQVKAGKIDFDVVIAAPEAMRVVGALGQILGPRGLMPNPKVGTVTPDVAGAVKNAKAGQVQFRADKTGIVQCTIGRASFTPEQLKDNLAALLDALNKAKPAATKGIFLKKGSVAGTMGVGVKVDPGSLSA